MKCGCRKQRGRDGRDEINGDGSEGKTEKIKGTAGIEI